jgi:ADP-ribosylglycohydrolase
MLGAIIGDIVGSRFELHNHRSKDFDLFADGCFATDDSIMTLAIAKANLSLDQLSRDGTIYHIKFTENDVYMTESKNLNDESKERLHSLRIP